MNHIRPHTPRLITDPRPTGRFTTPPLLPPPHLHEYDAWPLFAGPDALDRPAVATLWWRRRTLQLEWHNGLLESTSMSLTNPAVDVALLASIRSVHCVRLHLGIVHHHAMAWWLGLDMPAHRVSRDVPIDNRPSGGLQADDFLNLWRRLATVAEEGHLRLGVDLIDAGSWPVA